MPKSRNRRSVDAAGGVVAAIVIAIVIIVVVVVERDAVRAAAVGGVIAGVGSEIDVAEAAVGGVVAVGPIVEVYVVGVAAEAVVVGIGVEIDVSVDTARDAVVLRAVSERDAVRDVVVAAVDLVFVGAISKVNGPEVVGVAD